MKKFNPDYVINEDDANSDYWPYVTKTTEKKLNEAYKKFATSMGYPEM